MQILEIGKQVSKPKIAQALIELIGAWGYDIYALTDRDKEKIGQILVKVSGTQKLWGRAYISNILAGRPVAGKLFCKTVYELLSKGDNGTNFNSTVVIIIGRGEVPPGTQTISADQCPCGQWFISNHPRRRKCFLCSPFKKARKG